MCVFTELTRCVSFVRVSTCRNEEKHVEQFDKELQRCQKTAPKNAALSFCLVPHLPGEGC